MSLGYTKREDESFRDCVERYAKVHGLEEECLREFNYCVEHGMEEGQAVWNALYEWDVLELIE